MRVMIDTNILDCLDEDTEACNELINRRDILLLVTPAQEREVAAIPDPAKRVRLQDIMEQLCKRLAISNPPLPHIANVPAGDVPIGPKPAGWSSGEQAGTVDEMILASAVAAGCDLLVSNDIEVLNMAFTEGVRAMDWKLFLGRVVWVP